MFCKEFSLFYFLGQFDYSIIYNGVPFPDEATLEMDFGDGSPVLSQAFTTATVSGTYAYMKAGHFITMIRIYNDASENKKKILVNMFLYRSYCISFLHFMMVSYTKQQQ